MIRKRRYNSFKWTMTTR